MTVFLADYVTHTLFELCGGLPVTDFTDSYINSDSDLETAIGDNPKAAAVALKAAEGATQQWYCQEATKAIDRLPLAGFKLLDSQDLQFPRKYPPSDHASPWGSTITADAYGYIYLSSDVPQDILDACLLEAIALYSENASAAATKRAELQDQGVKSYSNGKLSETYGPRGGGNSYGIRSPEAWRILSKYIARGGACI